MQQLLVCLSAQIVLTMPSITTPDAVSCQAVATALNAESGGSQQLTLDYSRTHTWPINHPPAFGQRITTTLLHAASVTGHRTRITETTESIATDFAGKSCPLSSKGEKDQ